MTNDKFEQKMTEAISKGESEVYVLNKRNKDLNDMFVHEPELVNDLRDYIFGITDLNPMEEAQVNLQERRRSKDRKDQLEQIVKD